MLGHADIDRRQKHKNIRLEKGDEYLKHIKANANQYAHDGDAAPQKHASSRKRRYKTHYNRNNKVSGKHIRQKTNRQHNVLDEKPDYLNYKKHRL